MDKLITIWSFICRRKYLITVVAFAVIIGFLDENSLFRRLGYEREISQLKEEMGTIPGRTTKRERGKDRVSLTSCILKKYFEGYSHR